MNTLVLFKNNLRIQDNPVLYNAVKNNNIIPAYILDEHYNSKNLGSNPFSRSFSTFLFKVLNLEISFVVAS